MLKRTINLGLIGVGGFGRSHLPYLELLQRRGMLNLIAVADPDVDGLASQRAAFEAVGIRWYADYREMLDRERSLQAVQIVTPVPLHFEMAAACIDRGLFVHLEKPPVPLIQQLEELIARDRHQRVAVGFQHISSVAIQTLKSWIVEGRLGELQDFRVIAAWPRADSYYQRAPWAGRLTCDGKPVFDGPATNALSHVIHNIMFLAGLPLHEFASPSHIQAELYRSRPIESYDTVSLRGRFNTGGVFTCAFTHTVEKPRPFEIHLRGSRGWARIWQDGEKLEIGDGTQMVCEEKDADPFLNSHEDFLAFARGESAARSSLADTRGFLLATNGALVSSVGIHDVPTEFVSSYSNQDGSAYAVKGLPEILERSFREGLLFSEMDVPWARKTEVVPLENLRRLDLTPYMPKSELIARQRTRFLGAS